MIVIVTVNFAAVLVAALANMVLGAIWYSPLLFANSWMKLVGKTKADLKAQAAAKGYIGAAIGALVMAYILAHFVSYTGSVTALAGVQTGFWAWLGFAAPTLGSAYLFEGRPAYLYYITSGYHLVGLVIMGAILAAWR